MIRTCSFYQLIHNETYWILSGVCIKQTAMSFKKTNLTILTDDKNRKYRLTLDKDIKLFPGHHYRFYFRKPVGLDSGYINYTSADLLGYEELPAVTEAV